MESENIPSGLPTVTIERNEELESELENEIKKDQDLEKQLQTEINDDLEGVRPDNINEAFPEAFDSKEYDPERDGLVAIPP